LKLQEQHNCQKKVVLHAAEICVLHAIPQEMQHAFSYTHIAADQKI